MANYEVIMRRLPEVREFVRNRRWVHRGDVLFYGPNTKGDHFSTDPLGYRHSVFKGEQLGLADVLKHKRYGLVMGPSSIYNFGVSGNENTFPSLLADRFGFPFANIGLPEGNSRNLCSILTFILSRSANRPSAVVHISGGDYTSFCYTGLADPVFGPPNLKQIPLVLKERGGKRPPAANQIRPLLTFTATWISAIARLCQTAKVPLVLGDDTTFFEKAEPSEYDQTAGLGEPANDAQKRQFAIHRRFMPDYHGRRQEVAQRLGVPLVGPGRVNNLGFIDEFHYDRDGTRALADDYAEGLEPLL